MADWGLLDLGSARALIGGKSLWRMRYANGLIVSEWDCDWSLAPREGRMAVRLYAPNGQVAELGNGVDATGRLFQLKRAVMAAGAGSTTTAHIVGIVEKPDGFCRCAVWEYGPKRLTTFDDNAYQFRYDNIGRLAFGPLGLTYLERG